MVFALAAVSIVVLVIPMLWRWQRRDRGWGLLLATPQRIVVYYFTIGLVLCGVWGGNLGLIPGPWPVLLVAIALLAWGLFLSASLGPAGVAAWINPSKSSRGDGRRM